MQVSGQVELEILGALQVAVSGEVALNPAEHLRRDPQSQAVDTMGWTDGSRQNPEVHRQQRSPKEKEKVCQERQSQCREETSGRKRKCQQCPMLQRYEAR